jgi:hypothetical protein
VGPATTGTCACDNTCLRKAHFLASLQWAAVLCGLAAPLAHGAEDDAGTPLASVHVNELKTFANLPAEAPRAVWYGSAQGHGHGLGCGLLARGSKTITPLLEPGDDGEWPSCMGVPDATAFDWKGRPVYVYRYLQRDTREDTYAYDAFVRIGTDGIEGIDGLAPDDQPTKLTIAKAAAWAKASLAAAEAAKAGFEPSRRDTVLAERGFLAIGRNPAKGTCSISVDRLSAGGALGVTILPCKAILATTSLSTPQSDWLVAMTQGADGKPQGRVFEVGSAGVREAPDIEARLAPAVAGGKVLSVKAELKRVLGK